jgi:hypothetical protein
MKTNLSNGSGIPFSAGLFAFVVFISEIDSLSLCKRFVSFGSEKGPSFLNWMQCRGRWRRYGNEIGNYTSVYSLIAFHSLLVDDSRFVKQTMFRWQVFMISVDEMSMNVCFATKLTDAPKIRAIKSDKRALLCIVNLHRIVVRIGVFV